MRLDIDKLVATVNKYYLKYKCLFHFSEYMLHFMNDAHPSDYIDNMYECEKFMSELKELNSVVYSRTHQIVETTTEYGLACSHMMDAREQFQVSMEQLLKTIAHDNMTVTDMLGLVQQLGVQDLISPTEILPCLGNVYITNPPDNCIAWFGPANHVYFVQPYDGWVVTENTMQTYWKYPIAPTPVDYTD